MTASSLAGMRSMALAVLAAAMAGPAPAAERFITVASTTSTADSGLFNHILPLFEKANGIAVRVVALGTGQAIRLAERGDADVLLVHHRPSEEKFVADGFGVRRHPLMHNDFVLVGPRTDPARIQGGADALAAMALIAGARAPFVSRGDDSGTHKAETELWRAAGIDPKAALGPAYREAGSGMGATLNMASALGAYTLADRGSWAAFKNKGDLALLVQGDRRLFNDYGVILVNPARHKHVKEGDGQAFIDWLLSREGQGAIASFKVGGEMLFFPVLAPTN